MESKRMPVKVALKFDDYGNGPPTPGLLAMK